MWLIACQAVLAMEIHELPAPILNEGEGEGEGGGGPPAQKLEPSEMSQHRGMENSDWLLLKVVNQSVSIGYHAFDQV